MLEQRGIETSIVEVEIGTVALKFGIGILAIDGDDHIGGVIAGAVLIEDHRATGSIDRFCDPGQDRLAPGKFVIGVRAALPREGPPARSLGNAVRAIADNQHGLAGVERQQPAIVLEQYKRFAHRFARDGLVRIAAE